MWANNVDSDAAKTMSFCIISSRLYNLEKKIKTNEENKTWCLCSHKKVFHLIMTKKKERKKNVLSLKGVYSQRKN